MRRPSVLFINRVYPPVRGASGRVLRDLAKGFAKEGWHVTVVSTGPEAGKERDGPIRIVRVKAPEKPTGLLGYLSVWRKLYKAAGKQETPALLVTLSDPPLIAVAGQKLAQAKKCRHIHWCHDLYPDVLPALGIKYPSIIQSFLKRKSMQAMLQADRLIVIGRCMARQLAYKGITPKNITVIPNWPDYELTPQGGNHNFTVQQEAEPVKHYSDVAKPFEQQLKSPPKFRVLYAGNMGMAHPYDTIIDAAEILNRENPEIEFVFVGDGPRFDDIAREREKRGLDNIRLLPYQPLSRLRQLMESGDVHLISMADKAAGMLVPCKLYSSLAVGRPCIFVGPEASETAKVINDFKAGTVVPQGHADDLAARIKHYRLNSKEWFAAYNGACKAAEIYMPDEAINAWIERAWAVVKEDLQDEFDDTHAESLIEDTSSKAA